MSAAALTRWPAPHRRPAIATGALGVLVLGTIAYGLAAQAHRNNSLGTPLPPFNMIWRPYVSAEAALAVAVIAGVLALLPRALTQLRSGVVFAAAAYAATLAVSLSVNATHGTSEWSQVFSLHSFEGPYEYLYAATVLGRYGLHGYVLHYAALLPYLPTHAKGNPPGPVVAMHLLGLTTSGRLAAACILVGALTTPATYLLGRELGGERRGRVAAALAVLAPSLVLLGTTSADYAFAALGTITALLLVRPGIRSRAAGCLLAGVGSFSSWLLLAIPVWVVIAVLVRDGPRPAARLALPAGAGVLGVNLLLALTLGYDPIAVLRALGPIYAHGKAAERPYAFWLFGSPVAWLVMLGVPVVWLLVRAAAARDPAALSLIAIVLVSAVAGFTKAETERIWLPFVPFACVAAASQPARRLRPMLVLAAVQIIAVQLLFYTPW